MSQVIDRLNESISSNTPFCALEFFPPKTEEGKINLFERIERMSNNLRPAWIDITWGAGGSTSDLTVEIARYIQKYSGTICLMHLTCTNMPRDKIDLALEACKESGISNILALRGDPPHGSTEWQKCEGGFEYAVDLVKYIKEKHGDYFCIGVAGYPEKHLEADNFENDIQHLKDKVDAGGQFIITQMFYDVAVFNSFVETCRRAGIVVPIIPGILPIQTYAGFKRMTGFCQTIVPQILYDQLEPIKNDDTAVKKLGIEICVQMCQELLDAGAPGVHFYTINLEKTVTDTFHRLESVEKQRRMSPWRLCEAREETVRPIYWSNRPKSYVDRTEIWDDYPNGRWGDSRSPAFEFLPYNKSGSTNSKTIEKRKELWGSELKNFIDIAEVFSNFVEGRIGRLPWSEEDIQKETTLITPMLVNMNRNMLFTVTSQPAVNGADSSDPILGWGPQNGYVYAKAYVEFFCPPEFLNFMLNEFKTKPTLSYAAVNQKGDILSNLSEEHTVAITWGVFPNQEINQPTICDLHVFKQWKDEAFHIWLSEWGELYEEGSKSRNLLQRIHDTFYLVTVIDNDYVKGNLSTTMHKVIDRIKPINSYLNPVEEEPTNEASN